MSAQNLPRGRRARKLSTLIQITPGPLPTPCWVWTAGRCNKGEYGFIRRFGKPYSAHEYTFLCRFGYLPVGGVLDHQCDNKLCCNPLHVLPVTAAANCRRGANAKLDRTQVDGIRAMLAGGATGRAAAEAYGVTESTVSQIRSGRRWGESDKQHMRK